MERYKRGRGKLKLLGSHQKCWLWGRNLVAETLASGRWPVLELYLADSLPAAQAAAAITAAARSECPVHSETVEQLTRRCHTSEHQGYLARMAEFPYALEADVLAKAPRQPLYAIADGIQDPYNFGAILRSAEVFGVDAVFVGEKGQVPVTSMVARSSAGAASRVSIVRVADTAALAGRLRAAGVRIVGASEKAEAELRSQSFAQPIAIVVGNEGRGIGPGLLERCDALLRIPQHGALGSLNAAVAASIFFYEARRQREGN